MAEKFKFLLLALLVVMCVTTLVVVVSFLLEDKFKQWDQAQQTQKARQDEQRRRLASVQDQINRERVIAEILEDGETDGELYELARKRHEQLDQVQKKLDELEVRELAEPVPWWRLILNFVFMGMVLRWIGRALNRMGSMLEWVHRWNHRIARRLAFPRTLPFPVLIVRDAADEASTAMAGAQFVSLLTSLGLRWSAAVLPNANQSWRSAHWMGRLFRLCAAIAAFGLGLAAINLLDPLFAPMLTDGGLLVAGVAAGAFMGSILFSVLAIPAIWLLIVLLGLGMTPFGLRMALGALSLQMTAEGSPPGIWTVFQLSSTPRQLGEEQGLRHSTYDNRIALKRLQEWIAASAK